MAVPSPSISVSDIPGGVQHYLFDGQIGVAGVAQTLNIDLTAIPARIRRDKNFQDQLVVTVKSLEQGLTEIGPALLTSANFFDDGLEPNAYIAVLVTSDVATRNAQILVEARHTATR